MDDPADDDPYAAHLASTSMEVMLDSGAYSAWKSGTVIDVHQYGDFVERNHEWIHDFANLDVIPTGTSADDAETAAQQSWDNLKALERRGLEPIPVFHIGERWYWLEKLINEGYTTIGLGGVADLHRAARKKWFDQVFSRLADEHGECPVRLHGFGVTDSELLDSYPFYSGDSQTWIAIASNHEVMIPQITPTTIDYSRGRRVKILQKRDGELLFSNTAEGDYLASLGATLEGIQSDYKVRRRVNAAFYRELGRQIGVKLYLVGVIADGIFLDDANVRRRLISFSGLKSEKPDALEQYVTSRRKAE